jgi:hypothetical protein
VLSNYGELCISPTLLPQEYAYFSDETHLERLILAKDVHLVGEICHCLKVFGVTEESPSLSRGLEFLRQSQKLDGSFPTRRDDDDPYFRYHAAMCAASALNPQRFRGFGPSDPALVEVTMM